MVDIPGITEEELAEAKKAVYFNPIAPAYMLKKELGFTGSYLDKEKYNTYKVPGSPHIAHGNIIIY